MTSIRSFDKRWAIDNLSRGEGCIIPHVTRQHPSKKILGVYAIEHSYSAGLIAQANHRKGIVTVDYFEPCFPNLTRWGLEQNNILINEKIYEITHRVLDKHEFNKLYTHIYLNKIHGKNHNRKVEIDPWFDRDDIELGAKKLSVGFN